MQHRKQRRLRFLWLVTLSLLLSSCGAQWHLKRAIAKDPTIAQDTILRIDTTIITESIELRDTITLLSIDTIRIEKDGVVVHIERRFDTLLVDVECPPDTVRVFKEVPLVQYVPEKKERNLGIGAIIGFILALVLMRIVKRAMK
jgi:hypothetical protein|tara:strand:+ start:885 stop:1316 length:432 start_codon:yes stop_codon:yes gene_type:complete